MSAVHPTVRYLIICDDVQTEPEHPLRVTIAGLVGAIRSLEQPPYPLRYRELCAFLQMTECRGPAVGRMEIQHADSGGVIFRTPKRTIPFGTDPLELVGIVFRMQDILFPQPGLYWFQFWYNDEIIAQQPVLLR